MKKYLLFFIPLLFIVVVYIINNAFSLISQSSDIAVMVGVFLICVTILSIYLLIKILKK